jgi:hypothetical protein
VRGVGLSLPLLVFIVSLVSVIVFVGHRGLLEQVLGAVGAGSIFVGHAVLPLLSYVPPSRSHRWPSLLSSSSSQERGGCVTLAVVPFSQPL